jgi:hypothetical protein
MKKLEKAFQLFERAAAKGHEESIWILSVWKDVTMEWDALQEAFAKTEEPLGWWFAGEVSEDRASWERFDFYKKSAEGACSWGQVDYGKYFKNGRFVEQDEEVYLEWLEKAVHQNNPNAIYWLGDWFEDGGGDNKEKAVRYYHVAAELGWTGGMYVLANMLKRGEGCVKDLRQAVIWSPQSNNPSVIWDLLWETIRALESGATENFGCDFSQLCYSLGWGLYWYLYESLDWDDDHHQTDKKMAFSERCLDYYCSCVEEQQKSIFTFLLLWNQTTGVKGPGQMIAQMVWEGREDNLVKKFEQPQRGSARLKRIKK